MARDDMQPATKGDLRRLETTMKEDLQHLEIVTKGDIRLLKDDMHVLKIDMRELDRKLEVKFAAVQESIDQVLAVVINMNNRFTVKIDDHEHRIVALEGKAA